MLETLQMARLVALILAAASAWTFCLMYQYATSRCKRYEHDHAPYGHWRDDVHGVHLMVFTAGIAAILTYALFSVLRWVPYGWTPVASLVIYLTVAVLILWRIALLVRAQRRES